MDGINRYMFRLLVTATLILLAAGTIFYHIVEKWSFLNSYYFSVVSLTTVGYGDFAPTTPAGKIFTTFYLMAGVGILGAFVNTVVKRRGGKAMAKHDSKDESTKE